MALEVLPRMWPSINAFPDQEHCCSVSTGPDSIISTRKHHLQLVVMDTVIVEAVVAVSFVASSVVALKVVVFKASSSARETFLFTYSIQTAHTTSCLLSQRLLSFSLKSGSHGPFLPTSALRGLRTSTVHIGGKVYISWEVTESLAGPSPRCAAKLWTSEWEE